jgi:hypothetical protein
VSSEGELVVIAPEGVANGDTEVGAAGTLESVLSSNLWLFLDGFISSLLLSLLYNLVPPC